jgi:hypothetical protein
MVLPVHGEFSVPGVPGCEVAGLYGPVTEGTEGTEGLRLMLDAEASWSHEVRRPGLVGLLAVVLGWSGSSSEDAKASESGVDLLRSGFDLSRRREADPWWTPNVPKDGIGARVVGPALDGGLLMVMDLRSAGPKQVYSTSVECQFYHRRISLSRRRFRACPVAKRVAWWASTLGQ